MPGSLGYWIAAAVLLFWAVGAYNRLVRLRAAVVQAFAALDAQLREQLGVVQRCLPPVIESTVMPREVPLDERAARWGGLRGAAAQMTASLDVARQRPLLAERVDALQAACGVLRTAWQRLQQEDVHDLAGPAMPENLRTQWLQAGEKVSAATAAFGEAVQAYNAAVAQFPAVLLAALFGFKSARALAPAPQDASAEAEAGTRGGTP